MSFGADLAEICCPYCGEIIEVIVDLSVEQQEYVEDCSVCCRPIVLSVTAGEAGAEVSARHEDV